MADVRVTQERLDVVQQAEAGVRATQLRLDVITATNPPGNGGNGANGGKRVMPSARIRMLHR